MRRIVPAAFAVALALSALSCSRLPDGLYARIETTKGPVVAWLEYEKAPLTVTNFVGLAEGTLDAAEGTPFYDGLSFHRVVPDFIVQGGDPAGDGTGDAGYYFPNEIHPDLTHDRPGTLGMANAAPDYNGSQFYITLGASDDIASSLDGSYSVFGHVVSGMNAVKALEEGDRIESVRIERVGAAAQAFSATQADWQRLYEPALTALRERKTKQRQVAIATIKDLWPNLKERPDGILEEVLEEGSGPVLRRFWLVNLAYKGMLPNGQVFDESDLHGGPIEFELGAGQFNIMGVELVLLEMKKGEKRRVAIPPEYGYGPMSAAGGLIPANSYLIFELEVTGYTE